MPDIIKLSREFNSSSDVIFLLLTVTVTRDLTGLLTRVRILLFDIAKQSEIITENPEKCLLLVSWLIQYPLGEDITISSAPKLNDILFGKLLKLSEVQEMRKNPKK